MEGQIVKIIKDLHVVSCNNEIFNCKCRGKIRNIKVVPLVGDYCVFDPSKLVIEEILPRKNEFQRPPVSNITQAIIVTSMVEPLFSLNLLDRFLVTMKLHWIEAIICVTKEDIASLEKKEEINNYLSYYKKIGYKVISNQDLESIQKVLSHNTTVFTGQTGAGKSTLLNKLNPNLKLETGDISKALGRGKHTTRVVSLFEVNGGKVLDTPGFSSLEFGDSTREDIKKSFIEFSHYSCPFSDCSHVNEKECSVKKAVSDGKILMSRYENYIKFIEKR